MVGKSPTLGMEPGWVALGQPNHWGKGGGKIIRYVRHHELTGIYKRQDKKINKENN